MIGFLLTGLTARPTLKYALDWNSPRTLSSSSPLPARQTSRLQLLCSIQQGLQVNTSTASNQQPGDVYWSRDGKRLTSSSPSAQLKWSLAELTPATQEQQRQVPWTFSLTLNAVTSSDGGRYACHVSGQRAWLQLQGR